MGFHTFTRMLISNKQKTKEEKKQVPGKLIIS